MTGLELRARLLPTGKQVTEIARMAGISHQSLSQALKAQDVKTGLIEKLASALNLPLSYFYEEQYKYEDIAMNGEILRRKIKDAGIPIAEIARELGLSRPNLSQALMVKDVKSGLVEKVSSALKVPISSLYGEAAAPHCDEEPETVVILQERIRAIQQLLDAKDRAIQAYERLFALRTQGGPPPIGV